MTRSRQYVFTMEKKNFLTNLITFDDEISVYVDAGRGVDGIYLEFCKAFDTVRSTLERWTRQEDYGKLVGWSGSKDRAQWFKV